MCRPQSVGEVMAIGRSFEEAIQKAVRMVHPNLDGLEVPKELADLAAGVPLAASGSSGSLANAEGGDANSRSRASSPAPFTDGSAAAKRIAELTLDDLLSKPTDRRLFAVMAALESGRSVDAVHEKTRIDRWFLAKLANIVALKSAVRERGMRERPLESLSAPELRALKGAGFSDRQLARYLGSTEAVVRRRRAQLGVTPFVKQIDTLAAEFPAQTNYLYMTYHGAEHDVGADARGVMVLGCGAYCIGSSVEFDWSAVSCLRQVRASGYRSIVMNCNPETVSTDYDESDRLYFEELSLERVLDVYEHEAAWGLVVSVGGQIPNNLAGPLSAAGVHILGTSADNIDQAEDRHKFSAMLDRIGVDQPPWRELQTLTDAKAFADEVGFPVLVRPSFVLSGAAMNVAADAAQLSAFLSEAAEVAADKPVVISKYERECKEIEFDAVALKGEVLNYAISEHVENAGVHSGDATLVLPAQKLYVATIKQVKRIAQQIARSLAITGPFNIQFLARGNEVKVIECNLRASRSFPFVSKTLNCNFITLATRAMLGVPAKPYNISLMDIDYVAVKAPMFSFTRLRGADPRLGVEMSSTGEVACFGLDVHDAFLQALLSTGFKTPERTRNILVSIAGGDSGAARVEFHKSMVTLSEMGYHLYGTPGTCAYYKAASDLLGGSAADKSDALPGKCGYGVVKIAPVEGAPEAPADVAMEEPPPTNGSGSAGLPPRPPSRSGHVGASWAPAVVEMIRQGKVDLVINIPAEGSKALADESVTDGYALRRAAVDFGVGLITNVKCATMFVEAIERKAKGQMSSEPLHIEEFYHTQDAIALATEKNSTSLEGKKRRRGESEAM